MAATETPITELTPVYTDPAVLQGKAVLVHDPTTGDGIVFDASKLDPSEKYQKPSTGIPKTDLAEGVQESLEKADTALQPEDIAQEKGTDEEKVMSQKAVTGIFTELQLKTGVAEGLADTLSAGTAQEIVFRKSGGDGVNYMKAIKGKTLVWNQLMVPIASITSDDIFSNQAAAHLNDGIIDFTVKKAGGNINTYPRKVTLISGHKYYQASIVKGETAGASITVCERQVSTTTSWTRYSAIVVGTGQSFFFSWADRRSSDWDAIYVMNKPILIDLTLMFGADNEPSTVEEFEAMFPEAYYPYKAGTLISNDAEALETVGFNQWDEEWENGDYDMNTGQPKSSSGVRSKNTSPIPVIGGQTYYLRCAAQLASGSAVILKYDANDNYLGYVYSGLPNGTFTVESNCRYIRFVFLSQYGSTYKGDICINFSDASKNGTYEPYWKRRINLNLYTLKDKDGNLVFPYGGMNGAGTAFDMLKPDADGVIRVGTMAFKKVDLGTLNYIISGNSFLTRNLNSEIKFPTSINEKINVVCARYVTQKYGNPDDKIIYSTWIGAGAGLYVAIRDTSYTDAAELKAALSGVMLYYELATPVEFELAEPIPNSIIVDELGTEQAIFPTHEDGSPSAPICTDSNYSISVKNLVAAIKNINQA